MPSCPRLTPMLHSTIGLTAGSADHSPLHQWKASHGGYLHFKEKTFSKSVNTFMALYSDSCTTRNCAIIHTQCCTYIPDMSTNLTHFTKHMNKMIGGHGYS
ncbi:unnamed protein product [Rangifer tarandus platyrhynchus]|uniref:Uncharacterized protein n=2 Tax=Rangifer tarandus platyrhynchus TaxID=3082113 RepID=A0AC59Z3X8_RANTA|nr:unnamed protein product [Rangifer tarandus platyrhynchus]